MNQPVLIEDCYTMLLKQMSLVNDVHASIRVISPFLSKNHLKDDAILANFKTTDQFKNYPKTTRKLSDLKEDYTSNEELAIKEQSDWVFKDINTNTQYLYFGIFSSFSKDNRDAIKTFYAEMKTTLTADHIIVDLRSNRGGNSKQSDPFLKLLKKQKYLYCN